MSFYGASISKVTEAMFMLPEKDVPSAVVWTVRRWCVDCAAGRGSQARSRGCKSSV